MRGSFAIKRILSPTYEVELAKNTTEALSIISNIWCDLILLDIVFPAAQDYGFVSKLNQTCATPYSGYFSQ